MQYILDDNNNSVLEPDIRKWGTFFEQTERRIVEQTELAYKNEMVQVSTVFLATDHNFSGEGEPVLYETMVFGPDELQHWLLENAEQNIGGFMGMFLGSPEVQVRYTTRNKAIAGHKGMVDFCKVAIARLTDNI